MDDVPPVAMSDVPPLRLATRGSPLARWQAHRVAALLAATGVASASAASRPRPKGSDVRAFGSAPTLPFNSPFSVIA